MKLNNKVGITPVKISRFCGDIVVFKFVVSQRKAMTIGRKKNTMLLITRMAIFLATDPSLLIPACSLVFLTEMKIFMYKGMIVK